MTKQELLEMAKKLQAQAESMPDDTTESSTTTGTENTPPATDDTIKGEKQVNDDPPSENIEEQQEITSDGEVEEPKQIEPQTNGKITDDVTPSVDVSFEQSTTATETAGVEQVLSANLDQRFATMLKNYTDVKAEVDKMKVVLSEIMTRIELVQEVTDKVTTVDHDTLLSESIKLLV